LKSKQLIKTEENDEKISISFVVLCLLFFVVSTVYGQQVGLSSGGPDNISNTIPPSSEQYTIPQSDDGSRSVRDLLYALDDGGAETSIGGVVGDILWLNAFTAVAGSEKITEIHVAWGRTPATELGPSNVPNFAPCSVILYEDPNDDGDPSDAVFLTSTATTVQNVDTDILTIPGELVDSSLRAIGHSNSDCLRMGHDRPVAVSPYHRNVYPAPQQTGCNSRLISKRC